MKPPRTVVFDLGNVLLSFDYRVAAANLATHSSINTAELLLLLDQSPLLHELETGRISADAFFERFRTEAGYTAAIATFAEAFGDIFTPIQEMVDVRNAFEKAGFLTIVFSNTNELAVRHIHRRYAFFGRFHHRILSYQEGAMKPEAKLYEIVEKRAGFRGPDLLYIDDRRENLNPAIARGWRVIHHQTPRETIGHMRNMGLPVD